MADFGSTAKEPVNWPTAAPTHDVPRATFSEIPSSHAKTPTINWSPVVGEYWNKPQCYFAIPNPNPESWSIQS